MDRLNDHPYAGFIHEVEKPARYLGGEYNQIVKNPAEVDVQLVLAFPDLYDIGMSHLGTKILYSLVNAQEDMLCERAFAPWPDMEARLRERGLPVLSLETHRPLRAFDVVGFSLQYELTFTNVLNLLDLSGIPLHTDERGDQDPIVLAGGPVAAQPEPMAPFIDAFLIGDAEEGLPALLREVARCRKEGCGRRETLIALARLDGVYCPSLYETAVVDEGGFEVVTGPRVDGIPERPRRLVVDDLDAFPFPDDSPVAAAEAIFDRMSIEIARGCTEGCRFCQAGMIYRPVRERSPSSILDTLMAALDKGGYDEAGLTTLSTADYSSISPLIKAVMARLRPEKVSLSVASLRAYGLDEELLDEISSVRATGLTFAPEAGSQRLRDVINKNITEKDIIETAHRVFSRGWRRMKLYFMIGLPTETDDDVAAIMELGRQMKEIGRGYHRGRASVTISVSSHVPKPHTPFQWAAMDPLEEIERKQEMLFHLARRWRLEFRRHDPRTSFLEGIIGRGDRRLAVLIEAAWRRGARFDGWNDRLDWEAWTGALEETRLELDRYLGAIATDVRLPWDHLDMRLEQRFLLRDHLLALKGRPAPPCGKPRGVQVHATNLADHEADGRKYVCYRCGVACDLDAMRNRRAEFLRELSAFEASSPEASRRRREDRQRRIQEGGAPHDFHQGEAVRVRLQFTKLGVEAMTGHLDLVRKLPRVFRRARLPLFYTEGYHPKPAISFGPALSLGIESVAELAEVKLTSSVDADTILRRLNAVSEEGLRFTAGRIVEEGETSLSKSLARADYLVELDEMEDLPSRLADFHRAERRPITIFRKKKPREVDAREVVEMVRPAEDAELERWRELALVRGGGDLLVLRLRIDLPHTLKPVEALRAIVQDEALELPPARIARVGLWRVEKGRLVPSLGGEAGGISPSPRDSSDRASGRSG